VLGIGLRLMLGLQLDFGVMGYMIGLQHYRPLIRTFYTMLGYTGGEFYTVLRMKFQRSNSGGHLWTMAGIQNIAIGLAPLVIFMTR